MRADMAEARRLGGHNRKRSRLAPVAVRLGTVAELRAVLERVAGEVLVLDAGWPKARAVAGLVAVALRLVEVGELERRLAEVEARLGSRTPWPE